MIVQVFGSTVNSQISNNLYLIQTVYSVLVAETELTIGLASVDLFVPVAGKAYTATMRNTSAGGQNIRIGAAPAFGPNAGMLLLPGDIWLLDNFNIDLHAIANLAGGLLTVWIARTP